MNYITTKEASKNWGYSEDTIRKWCKSGLLSVACKAEKIGGRWQIPETAKYPKPLKNRK